MRYTMIGLLVLLTVACSRPAVPAAVELETDEQKTLYAIGVALSQHLQFTALDITIKGVSAKRVYERLLKWRQEGRFTGGLGYYPSSGFVHIDTRGRNASWWGA